MTRDDTALPAPPPTLSTGLESRAPALLIGGCVLTCGLMMALLGWFNADDDRWILLGFALGLFLLGALIIFAVRRAASVAIEGAYVEA